MLNGAKSRMNTRHFEVFAVFLLCDLNGSNMRVKYNRVSTISQTGDRFTADKEHYDLVLLDKISGSVPFKKRPEATKLVQLIEKDLVTELVVEELSRLGRNTGDVINNLEWLESKNINVVVRNIGLLS